MPLAHQWIGHAWFAHGFGRRVVAEESAYAKPMIARASGERAVQLGGCRFLLRHCRCAHCWWSNPTHGAVQCQWTDLPFAAGSLDFVVLVHTLEAAPHPHQVLREVARVLRPDGQLLIIGFNPCSLLAVRSGAPWRRRWLSILRLKDWLALLQLEPTAGVYASFLPPWGALYRNRKLRWLDAAGRRWWPVTGGVYLVQAVKRQAGMRLIRPAFKMKAGAAPQSAFAQKNRLQ